MAHQLPRLAPRNSEAEAEDNIVEAAFELLEQFRAGHTLGTGSVLKVVAELAFLGEVNALRFLFFAQLKTVAYDFGLLVFPVLAGSEVALLNGTFVAEALRAFQEKLDAFPATKTAYCIGVTSQVVLLLDDRFTGFDSGSLRSAEYLG
jgi:hypothetical protein